MRKIWCGDEVVVIGGKCRGQRGTVREVLVDGRCIVGGINLAKYHQRPNPQKGEEGGIVEREAPLALSNVAIFNSDTGKPDRVGIATGEDNKRCRVFKSTGEPVPENRA